MLYACVYQCTVYSVLCVVVRTALVISVACVPGPEMEDALDRESHALAAGLSLGMITLGVSCTVQVWSELYCTGLG